MRTVCALLRGWDASSLAIGVERIAPHVDPRTLTVYVTANSISEAAEISLDATEWATDYLAFSLVRHIRVNSQYIDPADGQESVVGERMDIPKFRSTSLHRSLTYPVPFALIDRPKDFCENRRAALRWYHKGMETPYDVDRFIFLWISLEILAKADRPELAPVPFRHSCGYELHECPTCNETLLRRPVGWSAGRGVHEETRCDK